MKKRQTIRVLGLRYSLEFADAATDELLQGNLGAAHAGKQIIKVDSRSPADQQRETLLHELLHISDLEVAAPEERLDEAAIMRVSRALFAIFRDNKGIAEWIASEGDE